MNMEEYIDEFECEKKYSHYVNLLDMIEPESWRELSSKIAETVLAHGEVMARTVEKGTLISKTTQVIEIEGTALEIMVQNDFFTSIYPTGKAPDYRLRYHSLEIESG